MSSSVVQQKKNVAIILFLAHEGVSQPLLWEAWRENALSETQTREQHRIKFAVHSPYLVKYGKQFCRQYKLKIPFKHTSWCSPSLVYEYIRCLRHIYETDPDFIEAEVASVFLVSGMDIPIASGKKLFEKNSDYLRKNHFCIISWRFHTQWISMNKPTIKLFLHFLKEEQMKQILLTRLKKGGCADEHFLIYFLQHIKLPNVYRQELTSCLTRDFRQKKASKSPIVWKNTTEKKLVTFNFPSATKINVVDAIRFARSFREDGDSILFFRKVSEECEFDISLFVTEFWNPTHHVPYFKTFTSKFIVQQGLVETQKSQRTKQKDKLTENLLKYTTVIEHLPIDILVNVNFDFELLSIYLEKMSHLVKEYMVTN